MSYLRALRAAVFVAVFSSAASAQFRDDFNGPNIDSQWRYQTGDGTATMQFRQGGDGYASIFVDGTTDRRGIWWAFIAHGVGQSLDLAKLKDPKYAIRVEARVRVSSAPKRVNLSMNSQRTRDFEKDLMEFDIDDTDQWHTISMTLPDFRPEPGDRVNAQLALMDWGLSKYRVDLDYFRVDIVDTTTSGPDQGVAVPYRPPVADPSTFKESVPVLQDSMVDIQNPDFNYNDWAATEDDAKARVLAVNGALYIIMRWDLSKYKGKRAAGSGLLELTTQSVERINHFIKDYGGVRVTEILGGDPNWDQKTVTLDSLRQGKPLDQVWNTQMIIDVDLAEKRGGKTLITISRPVLQRMLGGKTLGIVIRPQGALNGAVYSMEYEGGKYAPRLLFNVVNHQ